MSSDKTISGRRECDWAPRRFVFGTDIVAPRDQDHYLSVYKMYEPLWKALPETAQKCGWGTTNGFLTRQGQKFARGKRRI